MAAIHHRPPLFTARHNTDVLLGELMAVSFVASFARLESIIADREFHSSVSS